VQEREQILEILRKAYQIEVDGYTFYSMTAAQATKSAVKELFEKLAHDEVQHQNFLESVGKRYDAEGAAVME
jgi:rubrerythrin